MHQLRFQGVTQVEARRDRHAFLDVQARLQLRSRFTQARMPDAHVVFAGHEIVRYRTPARDLDELAERLKDAEVVVEIRERIDFSRALIERLPKLKLIALVGSRSRAIDYEAAREHQVRVERGKSG